MIGDRGSGVGRGSTEVDLVVEAEVATMCALVQCICMYTCAYVYMFYVLVCIYI